MCKHYAVYGEFGDQTGTLWSGCGSYDLFALTVFDFFGKERLVEAANPAEDYPGHHSVRSLPPGHFDQRRERAFMDAFGGGRPRSEEHTSELQSLRHLVCRLL